jgi:hypothetical protein
MGQNPAPVSLSKTDFVKTDAPEKPPVQLTQGAFCNILYQAKLATLRILEPGWRIPPRLKVACNNKYRDHISISVKLPAAKGLRCEFGPSLCEGPLWAFTTRL